MTSESVRETLIFVIGMPGSGKGTLCSKLAERFGWAHISVGDELRRLLHEEQLDDETAKNCVQNGQLVPAQYLRDVLVARKKMLKSEGCKTFIIDGFPRSNDQIETVQDGVGSPDLVICLECPHLLARYRVLQRRNPLRQDTDTGEVFDRRYAEFCNQNDKIIDYYASSSLVERVDTSTTSKVSFASLVEVLTKRGLISAPDSA